MSAYLSDGIRIYLDHLIDWEQYYAWRKGDGADVASEREALRGVLETAAQICAEIEPEARAGWEKIARLENGEVIYPPHIQAGYDKLAESGLISFGVDEVYGGFQLPSIISNVLLQMIARADAGLMTMVGLQAGVADDIQMYGSDELKQEYLPRFASGEVMGAMDLTEPQAGSDLGAITTSAREEGGRFFLDGEKIFITNGGCEIHLVLARDADTFDESKGTTRGLSLFLCPRTLKDGKKNGIAVTRLEDKLGIHGSPTAAIRFDSAEGFRVGPKGQGFKCMLSLMNNARLGVAAQGIGIAEAALSTALEYAKQRQQFGAPIIDQPLMKNMLARMSLSLEASRAILYRACALVDASRAISMALASDRKFSDAERSEMDALRERHETRIRLLTPLAKYVATETADEITRNAIQIHGGLGFMAESEVGKLHNDAIITTIYEGTSEIQVSFALKEIGKGALAVVFDSVGKELETMVDEPLAEYAAKVKKGMELTVDAAGSLMKDMGFALMSAQPLADVVVAVVAGAELLKQAKVDPRRLDLAASWINRRMNDLESKTRRIKEGSAASVERCEKIIALI